MRCNCSWLCVTIFLGLNDVAILYLAMKHKTLLLAATRKLVERKTAAAHGRSDALEEDITKVQAMHLLYASFKHWWLSDQAFVFDWEVPLLVIHTRCCLPVYITLKFWTTPTSLDSRLAYSILLQTGWQD